MAAYNFSLRSGLQFEDRPFTHANHIDEGCTNFQSFACSRASFQPTGSNL